MTCSGQCGMKWCWCEWWAWRFCWQRRRAVISVQRRAMTTPSCRRMTSPCHLQHCRLPRRSCPVTRSTCRTRKVQLVPLVSGPDRAIGLLCVCASVFGSSSYKPFVVNKAYHKLHIKITFELQSSMVMVTGQNSQSQNEKVPYGCSRLIEKRNRKWSWENQLRYRGWKADVNWKL